MSDVDHMISRLWVRARPTVAERLNLIEAAARASAAGPLDPALREDAAAAAHKLAGSLGSYGIADGSELARALEQELDGDCDPARLKALVADLRSLNGLTSVPAAGTLPPPAPGRPGVRPAASRRRRRR